MFFEEETKDTHGNMDDYDLDIEQGESVSWDKLLDDKDDLDEPADVQTEDESDDDDIADKLLNMDDDSFDAFIVKQQQTISENADNSSGADNEVDFDEFLLDDIDEETEDALKKVVKNDLSSDNNYEPEVIHEEEFEEDDVFDFIQDEEEDIQQITPKEPQETQNIQQEIAQINDLDDEEEPAMQFMQAEEDENETEVAQAFAEEESAHTQEQFAESTPDVPVLAKDTEANVGLGGPTVQNASGGNFGQKSNTNVPKKQNSSATIILLVALLLAAGGYYGYTNYGDKLNFGVSADTSMDIGQDNSLATPPQGEAGADISVPPADAGNIPAPPADAGEVAPSADQQTKAQAPADTQATKSVSKAVEQGRTKISKDKEADKDKTSIQVVTTGRLNPFVPVGNLNNIGFITTPKIDILPPNETLGQPDPTLDKLMSIKVSGILYDGVNSSAVINLEGVDYFVQKGDRIDSFTVVDITKTTVAIKEKNNIFSASIGQTFSNNNEIIKGQTQIQRQNNTIVRQYTTTQDIGVNPSGG